MPRKSTSLSLDADLIARAKAVGVNLSRAAEAGIEQGVRKAEAERWKEYNSYEARDHNAKTRERLREQFNSNTWEIALNREAEIGARAESYGLPQSQKHYSWKVPEIEQINRHFKENTRFFAPGPFGFSLPCL